MVRRRSKFRGRKKPKEPTQVASCTICGKPLFKTGGTPWLNAGIEGLPVCRGACLRALANWKGEKHAPLC